MMGRWTTLWPGRTTLLDVSHTETGGCSSGGARRGARATQPPNWAPWTGAFQRWLGRSRGRWTEASSWTNSASTSRDSVLCVWTAA